MKSCCFPRAIDVEPAAERVELHYGPVRQAPPRSPLDMMKAFCRRTSHTIQGVIQYEGLTLLVAPEVSINNYAVFMCYLSLAVSGLGYLVLTWTTVVLLGGFVSMLNHKDFWSLTVITLVQIIWVLDVYANERLSNIGYSFLGLIVSVFLPILMSSRDDVANATIVAGMFAALVQSLVFLLILFPLAAVYKFGLVISTAVSMGRLIQQDYIDAFDADPNKKNMRPALNVLYSLALIQGGLFIYRAIFSARGKGIASYVVNGYKFDEGMRPTVMEYLRDTSVGLEKDPSFVADWNLVTYAVGLLESKSPKKYQDGLRLLHLLLPDKPMVGHHHHEDDDDDDDDDDDFRRQRILEMDDKMQLLLALPSVDNVVRKLMFTLDMERPFGQEARKHAAGIMMHLASELRLEQLPGGLHRIGSLLGKSKRSIQLAQRGLQILLALKLHNEDNCRAMRETPSLLLRIIAAADIKRHQSIGDNEEEHDTWNKVASLALKLLEDLMNSGAKLPPLQGSDLAIDASAVETITKCDMCKPEMKRQAMRIFQDQLLLGDEAGRNNDIIDSSMNKDDATVPPPRDIEEGAGADE